MEGEKKLIKFEIVTPERVVLKEKITQVSVPTKMGEITVLPKHIPLVASLVSGVIEAKKESGEIEIMSISGGFIEVLQDKVVILADTAERAKDLDADRISQARQRAQESISQLQHFDAEEYASISAAIAKELARGKALEKWKKIKSLKD